jgi:hypothetical protein
MLKLTIWTMTISTNAEIINVDHNHSSKWVGLMGGLPPFRLKKKRDPPTLLSEALLSKKITKNVLKRAKIAKNAKSR